MSVQSATSAPVLPPTVSQKCPPPQKATADQILPGAAGNAEKKLENIEAKFTKTETVNRDTLIEKGLLSGASKSMNIKVIGNIALTKALNFEGVSKFSKMALESIKNSAGTVK